MFNAGDKIQVLSSNVRGSGPRTGSTGYVCTSEVDIYPRVGAVVLITAYFNKFGKELSSRCERKNIIGIVPMDKSVDKTIKNLHGKKFVDGLEEYMINYMPASYLKGAKTVVAPAPMTDIRKAEDNEKLCWLKSRLFAESKANTLRGWLIQQKNVDLLPFSKPDLYSFIALCGAPKKIIESSVNLVPEFVNMLNTVKAITTFGTSSYVAGYINNIGALRRIIGDVNLLRGIKEERALLTGLVRFMFKDEELNVLIDTVRSDQIYNGRSTNNVINKILGIRKELVMLSEN